MSRRVSVLSRRDYFRSPQTGVAISRHTRQEPIGQHRHEFFEIAVVLSGEGVHATGGFRHRIGPGEVLFLDPRRAHGYEETRDLNLLNILVRDDVLAALGGELGELPGYHALFGLGSLRPGPGREEAGFRSRLRVSRKELEQIEEWASRIEEASPGSRAARLLERSYLTLIVDVFCRRYGRTAAADSARLRRAAPDATRLRMGRLLGWIEADLAQPLRVADLAARAGMSERSFHRAFRAATGQPPHAYLLRARLARAARRLADPAARGESIAEAALACGFADGNHFARAFRAFAGTSPTAWRKRQARH